MAAYVEKTDLTLNQRLGLKWFSNHIPGPEIAGPGPFAGGADFSTNVLRLIGDKGFAARDAAKSQNRTETFAAAAAGATKADIEALVTAAFPDTE